MINKILNKIGRIVIYLFTPQNKNRILFIQESFSGSNSYALYKLASESIRKKYELILVNNTSEKFNLKTFFKWYRLIASSKIIFTTHASYKPTKKHIHYQLWHGGSTKKMGAMEHGVDEKFKPSKSWLNVDYIMSYSETYTTFLNACMVTDPKKYIITGAPRNDLLISSNGKGNLKKIFGNIVADVNLVWFTPTFRDYYGRNQGGKSTDNPFGFEQFDVEIFDQFLDRLNCKLILKPHPHEELLVLKYFKNFPSRNLLILKTEDLHKHELDFYEILNSADLLITDYSSLFSDFLLLDKPMIFTPVDVEKYEIDRGFLMESYINYVPGPIALDQESLQKEIERCFSDKEYYKEQRNWMLNFHHRYKDANSSARIFEFIENQLKNLN